MHTSGATRAGFAPVSGIRMYFETRGRGEALLLLHAGVADSRMWDNQVEEFSTTHSVITCDLRGFGQSRMSPGQFAHHEDVAALLDYLAVEKASVIGASFGGRVALELALAYPEVVPALVLAAPALGGYKFESAEMLEFFAAEEEALARGDLVAATELNLRMWVDGIRRNPGEVGTAIRERVREMQMNIFSQPQPADVTEKELEPPAAVRLSSILIPTLVIVGDKDVAEFQTVSALIAQNVQHGRLVVMPRTAHLVSMEKPAEFIRVVRDFLCAAGLPDNARGH